VPLTDDNRGDFHAYASNMYMDGEQNIWTLKETDAGELLVKANMVEDEASLKDLMHSVSNSFSLTSGFSAVASAQSAIPESVEAGDFVAFASGDTQRIKYGFVAASIQGGKKGEDFVVLAHGEEESETIGRDAVAFVSEVEDSTLDLSKETTAQSITAAAKGNHSLADILSYYKMVYARNPEYFAKFKERLSKHAYA
jgi:hypothetical protein